MTSSAKQCFVIAPIGSEGSDVRRRSDQILRHIIHPAVVRYDYQAIRADEIAEPGLITSQIIQHVISDALVIADITTQNPNVFYELAVRHAIRMPVVQLVEEGEKIPFDLSGLRTLFVNHRDLDSVEACRDQLAAHITAIEAGLESTDTPISVAVDLQQLRQSENPQEQRFAEILASLEELRHLITSQARANRQRPIFRPTPDTILLRHGLERLAQQGSLTQDQLLSLITGDTSASFDRWIQTLIENLPPSPPGYDEEPF